MIVSSMRSLSTLLVLLWINIVNADPTVTVDRTKYETVTGAVITLSCAVSGIENPQVSWRTPQSITYQTSIVSGGFGNGHQRYSFELSGDNYNLKISDVQPSDDGAFSCIVSPTRTTPVKIASVTVLVFVKPASPPVLRGLGGVVVEPHTIGQAVEIVTVPHGLTSAQVQCVVGPSKPAVPIKWLKDGEEVTTGVSATETTTDSDNLDTTTSILTVTNLADLRQRITGAQYKCMADLTAIEITMQTLTPEYKVFNLSVQYPPSTPVIEGFQNTTRQPEDTVALSCKTFGGNPPPSLQWYRNDVALMHEYRTDTESVTVITISDLVINVQASDNNAIYRCDAKNAALPEAISDSVKFRVQFAPKEVTITGHEQAKVGDTVTLSCTTANSNPRAVIIWSSRGRILSTSDGDTTVTDSPDGGFITQTNISVSLTRADHGVEYTCKAIINELNNVVAKTVSLDVLYPPDSLSITGFDASAPVLYETAHKMRCTSYEGNPLPDLTWYSGSTALTAADTKTEGKIRYRELSFIAQPKDNGAVYKCKASSAATASPVREQNITLSVQFPPQNITITPVRPMKADVPVTLTCNSGSSNPVSRITWAKNETGVASGTVSLVGNTPAQFGGVASISSYTFTPTASDNGLFIHCTAGSDVIQKWRTRGLLLDILHKPIFSGIPTKLTLQEGKNLTNNNFTAISNPAAVTYTWFTVVDGVETQLTFAARRDGAPAELSVEGALLHLTNINRNRAGTYRVKASNSEGETSADFQINVQYGAGIPDTPTQTYEDNSLKLHCVIDANPPVDGTQAKWTRLNYDMSRATSVVTGEGNVRTLTLTITDVVRDDIGGFTCEANNSLGAATKEYTVTPVAFAPVIDKAPSIAKSAAQTHDDGVILCNMDAFPQPTVSWSKGGTPLVTDGSKYSQAIEKEGQIHFSYKLTVKSVVEADYGAYKCLASNDKGSDTHEILLGGTSKPDPPTGLAVLNVTDYSVILTWVPGFNGGLDQKFNVRYFIKTEGSAAYLYADAVSAPFTIAGLEPESEYEFTVQAFNDEGPSGYSAQSVTATTSVAPTQKPHTLKPDEPMFIVIMALAVVGGLLLIVTTVLVCIFVRRRKRRKMSEATDSASQSNTVEMYGTHDGSFFNDDAKSYSTYEKGFDDDYAKHYEDDPDLDHVKPGKGTYITEDPVPNNHSPPWAKSEDPQGNYGVYIRQQPSVGSGTNDDVYAAELRNATKAMQQPEGYHRPAFVAGRPPAPPPPGRSTSRPPYVDLPPNVPERNYSPIVDYQTIPQAGMYHAAFGRSTPSVESTDDMRGHLV